MTFDKLLKLLEEVKKISEDPNEKVASIKAKELLNTVSTLGNTKFLEIFLDSYHRNR